MIFLTFKKKSSADQTASAYDLHRSTVVLKAHAGAKPSGRTKPQNPKAPTLALSADLTSLLPQESTRVSRSHCSFKRWHEKPQAAATTAEFTRMKEVLSPFVWFENKLKEPAEEHSHLSSKE